MGTGGAVTVEVLDADGVVLQRFARADAQRLASDSLAHEFTWTDRPDLSSLRGKVVRPRFQIRAAKVFSFGFQ